MEEKRRTSYGSPFSPHSWPAFTQVPLPSRQRNPNVILIFMGNFVSGELGSYDGGILRDAPTPRIKTLDSEGIRLLNFNVDGQVN